ncbi:MAG: hypothetical protein NTV34_01210 [Proteobacteria bacterium]|nr:hypothetical protein [Pseudomonadota bacterium]
MNFSKILICGAVGFFISSCKSSNSMSSDVKDIGFSDAGYMPKEMFRMVENDVILNACVYDEKPWRSNQNIMEACQFSEVRIPFSDIEKALGDQLKTRGEKNEVEGYRDVVSKEVALLTSEINRYTNEIRNLEAEKSKDQLNEDRLSAQIKNLKRKLSTPELTLLRQDQNVLFPLNFYVSVWERESEGVERNIKERLKSRYATATAEDRKEIALSYAAGPLFRTAWWNLYNKSAQGVSNPYFTAMNKIRSDQSRRINSSGKTFIFAAEKYTSLALQTVEESVASGLSSKSPGMVPQIKKLSCRDIFGGNARTATRDELVNAASDFKRWPNLKKISGNPIWAPLTIEGAKAGWNMQGWITWFQTKTNSDSSENQVVFGDDGAVQSVGRKDYQALMICVTY